MRSTRTLTPFFVPQSLANPSNQISYAGTKWLHWMILRIVPLSSAGACRASSIASSEAPATPEPLVLRKTRRLITGHLRGGRIELNESASVYLLVHALSRAKPLGGRCRRAKRSVEDRPRDVFQRLLHLLLGLRRGRPDDDASGAGVEEAVHEVPVRRLAEGRDGDLRRIASGLLRHRGELVPTRFDLGRRRAIGQPAVAPLDDAFQHVLGVAAQDHRR